MLIYLARPISGHSYEGVVAWYWKMETELNPYYQILSPMNGKSELRTELEFKAKGYDGVPVATNHAIAERDRWMVKRADVVLMDLSSTDHVSIGCMMELAWAHDNGKHTIVVLNEGNIHEHAFVLEAADIIFRDIQDAVSYLNNLDRLV